MKKLLIVWLLVILTACGNAPEVTIESCDNANFAVWHSGKPVILTANTSETNAVLTASGMDTNLMDLVESQSENICLASNSVVIKSTYNGIDYLIVKGPMGTDSNKAAEILFSQIEPSVAIFSGIAGGTAPDSVRNATFIPGTWIERETGNTVQVSPRLAEIANSLGYDTTISGVTAEQYVCDGDAVYQQYSATLVDMESYRYSVAASTYDKDFIAVRSISDLADCTQTDKQRLANNATAAAQSAPVALQIMKIYMEIK